MNTKQVTSVVRGIILLVICMAVFKFSLNSYQENDRLVSPIEDKISAVYDANGRPTSEQLDELRAMSPYQEKMERDKWVMTVTGIVAFFIFSHMVFSFFLYHKKKHPHPHHAKHGHGTHHTTHHTQHGHGHEKHGHGHGQHGHGTHKPHEKDKTHGHGHDKHGHGHGHGHEKGHH